MGSGNRRAHNGSVPTDDDSCAAMAASDARTAGSLDSSGAGVPHSTASHPPGLSHDAIRRNASFRPVTCSSTNREWIRSNSPGGSSTVTSWYITRIPVDASGARKSVLMSVAVTFPGPARSASIRATEPAPAPTSRHCHPGSIPTRSSNRAVTGSKISCNSVSRSCSTCALVSTYDVQPTVSDMSGIVRDISARTLVRRIYAPAVRTSIRVTGSSVYIRCMTT